jgi:hypothetical protein
MTTETNLKITSPEAIAEVAALVFDACFPHQAGQGNTCVARSGIASLVASLFGWVPAVHCGTAAYCIKIPGQSDPGCMAYVTCQAEVIRHGNALGLILPENDPLALPSRHIGPGIAHLWNSIIHRKTEQIVMLDSAVCFDVASRCGVALPAFHTDLHSPAPDPVYTRYSHHVADPTLGAAAFRQSQSIACGRAVPVVEAAASLLGIAPEIVMQAGDKVLLSVVEYLGTGASPACLAYACMTLEAALWPEADAARQSIRLAVQAGLLTPQQAADQAVDAADLVSSVRCAVRAFAKFYFESNADLPASRQMRRRAARKGTALARQGGAA